MVHPIHLSLLSSATHVRFFSPSHPRPPQQQNEAQLRLNELNDELAAKRDTLGQQETRQAKIRKEIADLVRHLSRYALVYRP